MESFSAYQYWFQDWQWHLADLTCLHRLHDIDNAGHRPTHTIFHESISSVAMSMALNSTWVRNNEVRGGKEFDEYQNNGLDARYESHEVMLLVASVR